MSVQVLKVTDLTPRLEMEVSVLLKREGLEERWLPGSELFVRLDSNGKLEGAACVKDFDDECLLLLVVVREDSRGGGTGSSLINHVLGYSSMRYDRIYLLTDRAGGFFERFGFSEVSQSSIPHAIAEAREVRGLFSDRTVAMVLNLSRTFSIT